MTSSEEVMSYWHNFIEKKNKLKSRQHTTTLEKKLKSCKHDLILVDKSF